jgi:hypothetical protein
MIAMHIAEYASNDVLRMCYGDCEACLNDYGQGLRFPKETPDRDFALEARISLNLMSSQQLILRSWGARGAKPSIPSQQLSYRLPSGQTACPLVTPRPMHMNIDNDTCDLPGWRAK